MEIHRAKPEDAATLTAIAFAAKQHWGYPDRWMEAWRGMLTIQSEFIAKHETYAARVGRQTVGFYSLVRSFDRMRLEHLWV